MILYHSVSVYQLLCCITHKILNYSDDKGILILPDFIVTKIPNYIEIQDTGSFEEIYLFPYTSIEHNAETINEQVEQAYKESIPYAIEEFDKVVNAAMHFYFSLYLINHNIEFEVFEDSAGVFCRGWALGESIRCSNEIFYQIIEEKGLFSANNKLITKCYCNIKAQETTIQDARVEDYDLTNKIQQLTREELEKLMKLFRCPDNIEVIGKSAIILTQHFSNLGQLTFEEQVLMYQQIVDYFLAGRPIIIKPHPDDVTYYGQLFEDAVIIRQKFPSELLPYIFKRVPEVICSVSSTGTHLIKQLFPQKLIFSFDYERTFKETHRYYYALDIINYLQEEKIVCVNADRILIENLLFFGGIERAADIAIAESKKSVCIVGNMEDMSFNEIKKTFEYKVTIFINANEHYECLEGTTVENYSEFRLINILKHCNRKENCFDSLEKETIIVHTKDKELMDMISHYSNSKILQHTGITTEIVSERELEQQVKVLKGVLKATERRLLYYKEKYLELKKKET